MPDLCRGRYTARFAASRADLDRALALRAACFRDGASDEDGFDTVCRHVLVEAAGAAAPSGDAGGGASGAAPGAASGVAVCTFRLLPLRGGAEIGRSYAAQFYDLGRLQGFGGPMAEVGRFCVRPDVGDADVLRVAWGAMTRFVDATGTQMLFGCSSFAGTEAARYRDAFAVLREGHLAPERWRPRVKARDVVRFAQGPAAASAPDRRRAMKALPPLLRTYLAMGGWVSDHAVVDRDLGTLHVFTGLEIAAIPPARARALRAVAG